MDIFDDSFWISFKINNIFALHSFLLEGLFEIRYRYKMINFIINFSITFETKVHEYFRTTQYISLEKSLIVIFPKLYSFSAQIPFIFHKITVVMLFHVKNKIHEIWIVRVFRHWKRNKKEFSIPRILGNAISPRFSATIRNVLREIQWIKKKRKSDLIHTFH